MKKEMLLIERHTNWEVRRDHSRAAAVLVGLFALAWLFFFSGCSRSVATSAPPSPPALPPVHLHLSGRYFLPECERYGQIPPQALLVLPTVQEAQLSGFLPAAGCSKELVAARIAKEISLFGEMRSTPEMERRKEQLLLRRKLDDIEDQQAEINRKLDAPPPPDPYYYR